MQPRIEQDGGDRVIVHEVRQAVAAEQHAIVVLQLHEIDVHLDILGRSPERVGQDVTVARLVGDRGRLKLAGIDQQLRIGMIARQTKEFAVAKKIRARIAHVRDQQIAAEAPGRRQRRAHTRAAPNRRGHARTSIEPTSRTRGTRSPLELDRMFFVQTKNPVRDVERNADERRDGHAARNFACGASAHAVGDHHHVVDFLGALRHVAGGKARDQRLQRAAEPA